MASVGVHVKAFRAVAAYVQGHESFRNRRLVKTWLAWDKPSGGAIPATKDKMPWCRMTLLGAEATRVATRGGPTPRGRTVTRSPFRVLFEIGISGTNLDDVGEVGDTLHDALFPESDGERVALNAALDAVGVKDVRLVAPFLPQSLEQYGEAGIVAQGLVEFELFILT